MREFWSLADGHVAELARCRSSQVVAGFFVRLRWDSWFRLTSPSLRRTHKRAAAARI